MCATLALAELTEQRWIHGYIFLRAAVAMARKNTVIAFDWLRALRGHDQSVCCARVWDRQRRGNLTAAGLCVASACGVGA